MGVPMLDAQHIRLEIDNMTCGGCAARAQKALDGVQTLENVTVNLPDNSAQFDATSPDALPDAIAALAAAGYPAKTATALFDIENMTCGGCAARVDKALRAVPGVSAVSVSLPQTTASVTYARGVTTVSDLSAAATAAGYPAHVQTGDTPTDHSAERDAEYHALLRQTMIAAALALPVFLMEMGGHLIPAIHMFIGNTIGHQASWMIQFLLTSAILIGPGRRFYRLGLPALRRGAPDMNSLVAVGTGAAYLFSVAATFAPALLPAQSRAVYFESAAVIVVLILLGRALEARAKGRTGAAIERLVALRPQTATRLRNGVPEEVALDQVYAGDILLVRPGETLPVDGTVLDGESHVDESMLSGEPIPILKTRGAPVTGGTLNGAGALRIEATHVGADTALSQIVRMVQEAQGARLPIQGLVDRITLWFVPTIMALAALTFAVWMAVGPGLSHAVVAMVSVLIIACPCAMGLATPTSIVVGTGRAAEMGVLFRKGDALQALSGIKTVALDKTGTITQGKPVLTDFTPLGEGEHDALLALCAAVEAGSEHPIAKAIVAAAKDAGLKRPTVSGITAVTGGGVRAELDGAPVVIGSPAFIAEQGITDADATARANQLAEAGKTVLIMAHAGRAVAVAAVSDPIKDDSAAAIAGLKRLGLRVVMITGDNERTAASIGALAGVDDVIANARPEDKERAIRDLQSQGPVAFVGDGINDAPALARADIGIAIGTGTDVAIQAADVVLMRGALGGVVDAFGLSRATLANIRQNLFWAFGYNVVLIPVAAGVLYPSAGILLSPVLAAGAMALSSVFVLSNALRLRRARIA